MYGITIAIRKSINENYQAIFKSGDEKVLTINKDGIFPEKISSMMEVILVNNNELKLYNNGDLYLYRKDIAPETSFSFTSIFRGLIGIAFFLFLSMPK